MPELQSRRARVDADPRQLSGDVRAHPGIQGDTIHKIVEPECCIRVGARLELAHRVAHAGKNVAPALVIEELLEPRRTSGRPPDEPIGRRS